MIRITINCFLIYYLFLNLFRTQTTLQEGVQLPPPDYLMCKLINMVNVENPPCSNCDKRDPSSMYFCSTCGKPVCFKTNNPHPTPLDGFVLVFTYLKKMYRWLCRSSFMQALPRKHSPCKNVFVTWHCANVQALGWQNRNSKPHNMHKHNMYYTIYTRVQLSSN